jgi:transposase
MEFKNIVGIDTGKETLEFAVWKQGKENGLATVNNTVKKLESFIKSQSLNLKETLFCMEHTGIYCLPLLKVLQKMNANVWVESAVQIKKSIGLTRGKSDKIDAQRIAQYAYIHQKNVRLWQPERKAIVEIKDLLSQRSRLIKAKNILQVPLNEGKCFIGKEQHKILKQTCKASIAALEKDLDLINQKIESIIDSDETLKELNSYVTSVPYIGKVIGAAVLVATNEFKKISDPKKFACHSGIAPFEHTSGKSIRGKTRVSHLANKGLKTLLHLAALGAISKAGEFKEYYERKLKEGKNKMQVINAVRNKLIHRLFACVNNKRKYQKNYLMLA